MFIRVAVAIALVMFSAIALACIGVDRSDDNNYF